MILEVYDGDAACPTNNSFSSAQILVLTAKPPSTHLRYLHHIFRIIPFPQPFSQDTQNIRNEPRQAKREQDFGDGREVFSEVGLVGREEGGEMGSVAEVEVEERGRERHVESGERKAQRKSWTE